MALLAAPALFADVLAEVAEGLAAPAPIAREEPLPALAPAGFAAPEALPAPAPARVAAVDERVAPAADFGFAPAPRAALDGPAPADERVAVREPGLDDALPALDDDFAFVADLPAEAEDLPGMADLPVAVDLLALAGDFDRAGASFPFVMPAFEAVPRPPAAVLDDDAFDPEVVLPAVALPRVEEPGLASPVNFAAARLTLVTTVPAASVTVWAASAITPFRATTTSLKAVNVDSTSLVQLEFTALVPARAGFSRVDHRLSRLARLRLAGSRATGLEACLPDRYWHCAWAGPVSPP